jgi:hypothetical protein
MINNQAILLAVWLYIVLMLDTGALWATILLAVALAIPPVARRLLKDVPYS